MQRRYVTVDVFTIEPLGAIRSPCARCRRAVDGADAGNRTRVHYSETTFGAAAAKSCE